MKTIAILLVIFAAQAFSQDLLECFAVHLTECKVEKINWPETF